MKGLGFSIGCEEVKQVKYQVKSHLGRNNFSACTEQLSFALSVTQSTDPISFDFVCALETLDEPRRSPCWLPGRWLAAGRRDDGARIVCFTHTHTHMPTA